MTDTTKKAMTFKVVIPFKTEDAANAFAQQYEGSYIIIDAHLSARREGEAVAMILHPDGVENPWFSFLDYKRLQSLPDGTRLYTAPPHPRVEVTEEMVEIAVDAQQDFYLEHHLSEFIDSRDYAEASMRAALEAALSEKGHE